MVLQDLTSFILASRLYKGVIDELEQVKEESAAGMYIFLFHIYFFHYYLFYIIYCHSRILIGKQG